MKFNRSVLTTKLRATGVHLCLSLLVFVYLAYLIKFDWYPDPYFLVDGGWQGIRLVAAVDLVLGPLITFLIFDLRKSRRAITFDLMTIAVIQFSALGYGIYTTYSQRPVAIVLIDEFVVPTIEADYLGTLDSMEALFEYSDERPPIIYAEVSQDRNALAEIDKIKREQGLVEQAQINLYQPKSSLKSALQLRQVLFNQRLDSFGDRERYDAWLMEHGKSPDQVMIAPYNARYGRTWLVFDPDGRLQSYF